MFHLAANLAKPGFCCLIAPGQLGMAFGQRGIAAAPGLFLDAVFRKRIQFIQPLPQGYDFRFQRGIVSQ